MNLNELETYQSSELGVGGSNPSARANLLNLQSDGHFPTFRQISATTRAMGALS